MILEAILGSAVLTFPSEFTPTIMNTVAVHDIRFRVLNSDGETSSIKILLTDLKRLKSSLDDTVLEQRSVTRSGLPPLIMRYKRRWGIAVGAVIFAVLISISGLFVWSVNVDGNKNISDKYIIDMLQSEGFGVGSRIATVNFDLLHNRFLIDSEGIGWISINMNGTHANVEVRETVPGTENEKSDACYNLVAAEDGQIERVAAVEGKPQVKIFDTVQKGELLVSGVISRDEGGIRLESASGSVFAKVNRSFEVRVPLESERKTFTGNKKVNKSIKFFAFNINLFRNSGIPYDFYDTIVSEKQVILFNTVFLPVWTVSSSAEEYENKLCRVTEEEARNEATILYREKLREQMGDSELLTKSTEITCDGAEVVVKCELYCIADIAKPTELIIEGELQESGSDN